METLSGEGAGWGGLKQFFYVSEMVVELKSLKIPSPYLHCCSISLPCAHTPHHLKLQGKLLIMLYRTTGLIDLHIEILFNICILICNPQLFLE